MTITRQRNPLRSSRLNTDICRYGFSFLLIFLSLVSQSSIQANGEISQLITSSEAATPSTITIDETGYRWGQGENLAIEGFEFGTDRYLLNRGASGVSVIRRDIPGVAIGQLCGLFAELKGNGTNELEPDFPALADQPDNCDMSAILMSSSINLGTLDTFTNTGTNPNNIERLDYRFDGGITAPDTASALASAGHVIGEKHGNNRVQMAAILAIDNAGHPTQYGPLVSIGGLGSCTAGGICYGRSNLVHDYGFFKSHSLEPSGNLQEIVRLSEPVAFAFLSMETLGIPAGSVYFGISVFPHDINANEHDLLDTNSFPQDTEENEVNPTDTADIYGGSAFLYAIPSGISGGVFCQAADGGAAPLPGVPVSLFRDSVADGVLDPLQDEGVAQLPGTGADGRYAFLGLENGSYFVVAADEADVDSAPLPVIINSSPDEQADIFLGEPCTPTTAPTGPTAVDDSVTTSTPTNLVIAVLANDLNAQDEVDAAELSIFSVSESSTAELTIQGRNVVYTASKALRDQVAEENRTVIDRFTYLMQEQDKPGSKSEATVTVTILPPDEPVGCIERADTDCFFIETEVEGIGVGSTPAFVCFLLLVSFLARQYVLIVKSEGDQS